MVKAILWDIDDTLFDYAQADTDAATRHLAAEGLPHDTAALTHWRTLTHTHYTRFTNGELTFTEQRRERVRAYLGPTTPDAQADAWFDRYLTHFEQAWTAFPDADPTLTLLTHPLRHAILSNSTTPLQERKLTTIGLRHHFEFLACSHEIGHAKPAPEAFHHACATLDLPPHDVAYIGDLLHTDAHAAHNAGLHAIWIDRTPTPPPPLPPHIHRITTLTALPTLLPTLHA
ncbi:HAD family hydrolase [Actinocorallia sp. A-T 12471]|uniref:HAD family hydrolase n=1 Tax=Actinocorallia sp. A-T 12471 TaxID=3089813 RepID=UPI0029CB7D8C|nr:HAD family hydrolase [Actinocorallia sp. A-T 12471]MDX6743914.1 HAD family hydrolase [Actinocorallia sp. A-T 12471]